MSGKKKLQGQSQMSMIREYADLSQHELARLSGVSRSMISGIERIARVPSLSICSMLATALGISTADVVDAALFDNGL